MTMQSDRPSPLERKQLKSWGWKLDNNRANRPDPLDRSEVLPVSDSLTPLMVDLQEMR